MAAVTVSGSVHTVVGTTYDGKKIVVSDFYLDTGTTVGSATVKPLTRILAWSPSVKHPGSTPATFVVTVSGNQVFVTPSANPTSGVISVMSIGV